MKLNLFIIVLLIIFFIPMFIAKPANVKISPEVLKEFSNGEEKVNVVIKLKELPNNRMIESSISQIEEKNKYRNYISKNVSLKELGELNKDKNVEFILESPKIHAFLQETVDIVNSTLSNDLTLYGINLTGTSQMVCVVDSGIDFTHPDLIGKNKSCIIDCFDKLCVENCSIGDNNGHGTHVAGIVGASRGILGITPNVSLIGVKILDENGLGSGNSLDLNRAVDYCVSQNVSVITMSLGTSTLYNSDCSSSMGAWTESIDEAFSNNISVIVASGNNGNTTHIASPACIANVTPVADTYDSNLGSLTWTGVCTDASTNVDKIVCHANRNSLVQLFAPGALINSTKSGGGYIVQGGTSMSTPVVAGAYAIIYQLLDLTGRTMNNSQIEEILNNTGKTINDAISGLSFTRIDVYEAILFLDNILPNVTLNFPVDENISLIQNQNFTCNYSDWQLSNATFYLWNSSGVYYNESKNVSGIVNSSVFNISNLLYGDYYWNCLVHDNKSNFAFADSNSSLTIARIIDILNYPDNNSYVNSPINFSCNLTSSDNYDLSNVTFYLWNSSGIYYNESKNVSGSENQSVFNYNFSIENNYLWNCLAFNNNSQSSWAKNNFSITYDLNAVNVNLNGPSDGISYNSNNQSIVFYYNVSEENEVANCSLIVNEVFVETNESINKSLNNLTFVQTFLPGTYNWNINCLDNAGNLGNSVIRSFIIVSISGNVISSSSGGGSGGGVSNKIYVLNQSQSLNGYTQKLNKNDKIKFTFFDVEFKEHILTINKINSDSVELIILSEPINIKLGIGQSVKLNLTSLDYYDLYLKLNSIENNRVEITIQTIHENIFKEEPKRIVNNEDDKRILNEDVKEQPLSLILELKKLKNLVYILIVIIVIIFVYLLTHKTKPKNIKFKNKQESFLKHLLEI